MKSVVACHHCGAKFKALTDNVPDHGRASPCPLCGQTLHLWKSDDYYHGRFAPEIAAFLLDLKQTGAPSLSRSELEALLLLEEWLRENGTTLREATSQVLQRFLAVEPNPEESREILQRFYGVLARKGLVSDHPLPSQEGPSAVVPPGAALEPKREGSLGRVALVVASVVSLLVGAWAARHFLASAPEPVREILPGTSGPRVLTSEGEIKPVAPAEPVPVQGETLQQQEKRRMDLEMDRWAAEVVKRAEWIQKADQAIMEIRAAKARQEEERQRLAKEQAAKPSRESHCKVGDCRNGTGTYRFDNGEEYVGEWRNGQRHGIGTYTFLNGEKYRGDWRDDRMEGKGVFHYQDGARYDGEWRNNQRHGQGSLIQANGDKYVGHWRNDKKFGPGTRYLMFADFLASQQQTRDLEAQRARAEEEQAKQAQQSRLTIEQAIRQGQTGCVQGDCENGKGVYIYSSGDYYSGDWAEGNRQGQGIYVFKPGDYYTGSWYLNQKHGQGSYVFKSGQRYDGGWWLNKKHGQGTITFANGIRQRGQWDNGEMAR
ncbi:MAG: hypothetical protein HQM03_09770 [Magnetococcales bacterium]|nr:hypothetical protein [Magnetococcales bacterium]